MTVIMSGILSDREVRDFKNDLDGVFKFLFFLFLREIGVFCGSVMVLFWTFGDIFHGFKGRVDVPSICILYFSYSPLVLHLLIDRFAPLSVVHTCSVLL